MDDCISRIKELELLFSDNRYDGCGESAYMIEKGSIPVMVSAPHATNHFRDGRVKWAEMYTGGIARYLHEKTGCHVIYTCKFTESDPNYDPWEANAYQNALKEYLGKHRIYLLLDIHGAAREREYAVEMGTAPGEMQLSGGVCEEDPSLQEYKYVDEVINKIFEDRFRVFKVKQNRVWKNKIFDAGDQNTITKFVSGNTDTASIQLEINGIYRDPEDDEKFQGLVESLMNIIGFFAELDWTLKEEDVLKRI